MFNLCIYTMHMSSPPASTFQLRILSQLGWWKIDWLMLWLDSCWIHQRERVVKITKRLLMGWWWLVVMVRFLTGPSLGLRLGRTL